MILIIDNYDSFVHTLARYVGLCKNEMGGYERTVMRNDAITLNEIAQMNPAAIIISPGPGAPKDAGICNALIARFAPSIPILGVCLGHQCIGSVFGGRIVPAPSLVHGRASFIRHDGCGIFSGLPERFAAGRYHSLAVTVPHGSPLEICAISEDDNAIMAIRHKSLPVWGVQFHPESILTPHGRQLIANFLELANEREKAAA
jgi:anthranilate synthase/aminodeoxychorismate synthase-like glutamine amidotransferase